jgi:L-alanine-DL-glutamate epimerase-like enolase superfamily enzyme
MSVRIAAVEAHPLALPLRKPMRLASETITAAETLLVRVVDEAGREGWGEASVAPTMTGDLLPGMVAAITRFIGPALCAAPVEDPASAAHRIARAIRGNTGAKAAAEIAMLDLFARVRGVPLAELLGVPRRDRAPAILMLGEGQGASEAQGASHVKAKLGMAAPAEDAAAMAALRAALGPGVHLSGDANMAWSVPQALAFAAALPPGVLDYLEQPVADDDLAGMAAVAAALDCPVCFDEGLHGPRDITAHAEARAAGGVGLKAIKLGGLQATLAADALARGLGLRTTWACKIAESSIGAAALLHAVSVLPEVEWGVSVTHRYLVEDVVAVPVAMAGGDALLPPGPGLGIAPTAALLARYRWRG